MGNGQFGTAPRSAKVVDFKLIGTIGTPRFTYSADNAPTKYKIGFYKPGCTSACDMNYGGPGF